MRIASLPLSLVLGVCCLTVLAGCLGESGDPAAGGDQHDHAHDHDHAAHSHLPEADNAAFPDGLRLGERPADVQSIATIKDALEPGKSIVVYGRVGGKPSPLLESAAVMTIADDREIAACDSSPDDHCPKPWDYCCVSIEDRRRHRATVQVLNAEGKPIASTLHGLYGIAPHQRLVVSGTVAEGASADNLIINATGIYVEQDEAAAPKS